MNGISSDQELQIKELIAKGQKISAVKLYREMTSVGLAEAKDAMEAIERGESANTPMSEKIGEPASALEYQIRQLLTARKKIDAVRVYREAHNCGLKDAKDAVDIIEDRLRKETRTSLPSTPAISDDPFAEDSQRNRRFLALVFALALVVIAGLVFFFLRGNGF